MPASNTREDQRNAQIFSVLFWVGVGLAPLAALVLLIGSGTGSLRACLGLVILSVILIGVSIMLRRDSDGLRAELEDTVFEEIDALRADVRDDIAHAAQATHRAFGEKMQFLLDQIESTKADLAATKVHVDALRHGITSPPPPPPQRHAASAEVHQPASRPGMPPGVVRHTETVQVTTRHTVMDPHDEMPRGTTYGRPAPVSVPRAEESWTDQRLREQHERRREEPAERWQPREPREPRESYADQRPGLLDDDERRPGFRAGDRWASVRSDDRGRELRMGERRAALHSDGSGTELRIEDRWAAVRREAGLPAQSWQQDDYRDYDPERPDRRAITGADREERWSDYQSDYDRERDRDYDRRWR
ncbi:hypothetical protein [Allorhizocola rhizosphaerae]|uniref:hypothetical protein n=1 Tax=Allorhizocola rhizosphaerae TaxID=1872709 RepID=UPI000E3CE7C6|nr:hypothetical protein [Allorhizocola rhizosphaerae]